MAAFFQQRHSILASLALHVSREFGVPLSEIHYDPTHLVLHGGRGTAAISAALGWHWNWSGSWA